MNDPCKNKNEGESCGEESQICQADTFPRYMRRKKDNQGKITDKYKDYLKRRQEALICVTPVDDVDLDDDDDDDNVSDHTQLHGKNPHSEAIAARYGGGRRRKKKSRRRRTKKKKRRRTKKKKRRRTKKKKRRRKRKRKTRRKRGGDRKVNCGGVYVSNVFRKDKLRPGVNLARAIRETFNKDYDKHCENYCGRLYPSSSTGNKNAVTGKSSCVEACKKEVDTFRQHVFKMPPRDHD